MAGIDGYRTYIAPKFDRMTRMLSFFRSVPAGCAMRWRKMRPHDRDARFAVLERLAANLGLRAAGGPAAGGAAPGGTSRPAEATGERKQEANDAGCKRKLKQDALSHHGGNWHPHRHKCGPTLGYLSRRSIAAKVLSKKSKKGYVLSDENCLHCEMPLMTIDGSRNECKTCPAIKKWVKRQLEACKATEEDEGRLEMREQEDSSNDRLDGSGLEEFREECGDNVIVEHIYDNENYE
ncbi:hypothetical protein THAOC_23642, partial [Thalassiosira oceanica]